MNKLELFDKAPDKVNDIIGIINKAIDDGYDHSLPNIFYFKEENSEWILGFNYEGFGYSIILYPDGSFYKRTPLDGEDHKINVTVEEVADYLLWSITL